MSDAVRNLAVNLSLDLQQYTRGLEAMVAASQEAAREASAGFAAMLTGTEAPQVDLSGLRRIVADAEADLGRLREEASKPVQVPALLPPEPTTIPAPEVEPPKVPPFDTTSFPEVKARVEAMLEQPLESLTLTLAEVQRAKAALDRQMMTAATAGERAEVAALSTQLDGLETKMRAAATAQSGLAVGAGNAQNVLFGVVNTVQDATAANGDWGLAMRYTSNNAVFLAQSLSGLSAEALRTGTSIRQAILSNLMGPTGFMVAAGALVSLLPTVVSWLGRTGDAFEETGDKAKGAADALQEFIDAKIRFEGTDFSTGVTFTSADQVRDTAANIEKRLRNRRRDVASLREQVEAETELVGVQRRNGEAMETVYEEQLTARGRALQSALDQTQRAIREDERRLGALRQRLATLRAEENEQAMYTSAGATTTEEVEAQQRAEREAERERERGQRKATRDAERAARDAAEEAERLAERRIELGADVAEAERETSAAARLHRIGLAEEEVRIAGIVGREQIEAAEDGFARRSTLARLAAGEAAALSDLARQRAEAERDAAVGTAEETYRVRAALARARIKDAGELAAELEALEAGRDAALLDAARRHESDLTAIRRRGAEARAALRAGVREAEAALERAVLDDMTATLRVYGDRLDEQMRRRMDRMREEQERVKGMTRQTRDALRGLFGDVAGAVTAGPQYSDEEAQLKRDELRAEEREIQMSLRRREGDQAKHQRRLRALRMERAEFEAQVERDNRSDVMSGAEALYQGLRGELARWLIDYGTQKAAELLVHEVTEGGKTLATLAEGGKRLAIGAAEIAQDLAAGAASMVRAAGNLISQIIKTIPFPLNLLAIGGGVAALGFAWNEAKGLFGFEVGGYTGEGRPDEVAGLVHKGEVVFEAGIVQGQVGDVLGLRALLQSGVSAGDLLALAAAPDAGAVNVADLVALTGASDLSTLETTYAVAAPAPALAPAAALAGPQGTAVDLSPVVDELRSLSRQADRQNREIERLAQPRAVSAKEARRLQREARREERIKTQRL